MALTGSYIRKWREGRELSARELGLALGYRGREMVKKIESGATPLTDRFAARFEQFKNRTQSREYRERKIQTRYALPMRIKILVKPRRCRVCREWFIFGHPRQRICTGRQCRRAARRLRAQGGRNA